MPDRSKKLAPTERKTTRNMALVTADSSCHAEGERMAALLEQFDPVTLERLGRQLAAIPLKVQAYLGLATLGWSQRKIAELFDVRQQTVFDALSRWDPECIFRGNPKAVLAIRAALAMKMSDTFLFSISYEDVFSADISSRMKAFDILMGRSLQLQDRVWKMEAARERERAHQATKRPATYSNSTTTR
jgi:hypothetical protein